MTETKRRVRRDAGGLTKWPWITVSVILVGGAGGIGAAAEPRANPVIFQARCLKNKDKAVAGGASEIYFLVSAVHVDNKGKARYHGPNKFPGGDGKNDFFKGERKGFLPRQKQGVFLGGGYAELHGTRKRRPKLNKIEIKRGGKGIQLKPGERAVWHFEMMENDKHGNIRATLDKMLDEHKKLGDKISKKINGVPLPDGINFGLELQAAALAKVLEFLASKDDVYGGFSVGAEISGKGKLTKVLIPWTKHGTRFEAIGGSKNVDLALRCEPSKDNSYQVFVHFEEDGVNQSWEREEIKTSK